MPPNLPNLKPLPPKQPPFPNPRGNFSYSNFPVRYIRGVGPKIAELFAEKGLSTAEHLLGTFPYKYLDRRQLQVISDLMPGKDRVTAGRVLSAGIAFAGFRRRRIFEVLLGDSSGVVSLKWFRFNPRQMLGSIKKGMVLLVSGEVSAFRNENQFIHPTIEILGEDLLEEIEAPGIVPVYSQIRGLGQKVVRRILRNALELFEGQIPDPLPDTLRERLAFPSKEESLKAIHFPSEETPTSHFRREIFEEFFFMELGLALRRKSLHRESGIRISVDPGRLLAWEGALPFQLTVSQKRVFAEILRDLESGHPMHRLLQGDVGSGKTVVALLSCLGAIEAGHQAAIMAPTEILAEQHFQTARRLMARDVSVALLTSRLDPSERRRAYGLIGKGRVSLVIGTHALIAENLVFRSLGLAVIDEQHRFGVLQRAALKAKGQNPHLLVMTATPIPRTLAMTLYGDLDLSVINELPPGRQPIHTQVLEEKNRRLLYAQIREVLERGGQGYIVYPLIEESEKLPLRDATKMSDELKRVFPNFSMALLHGKTDQEEKERIMRSFKAGEIRLLVSTTVIEVGIDVPQATLMVIEHAERFGLSQLHQLRGRVGRGDKPSLCILVTSLRSGNPGFKRLEILSETENGFRIAEEDLKIRGPGDFLGTRQSGLPELQLGNLIRDYSILVEAREAAFDWMEKDPSLSAHPPLRDALKRRWGDKLRLADVG